MLVANRWILEHFKNHLREHELETFDLDDVSAFVEERFGFDMASPCCAYQLALRKPLLTLWEFAHTGSYRKTHLKTLYVPKCHSSFYGRYASFVNALPLARISKSQRLWAARKLLFFITEKRKVKAIESVT